MDKNKNKRRYGSTNSNITQNFNQSNEFVINIDKTHNQMSRIWQHQDAIWIKIYVKPINR